MNKQAYHVASEWTGKDSPVKPSQCPRQMLAKVATKRSLFSKLFKGGTN